MDKRIAVIADVHANDLALDAVIADAEAQGCESFWFLGDITGRGPHVVETARRLRALYDRSNKAGWIGGNHDRRAAGGEVDSNDYLKQIVQGDALAGLKIAPEDVLKIDEDHRQTLLQYDDLRDWIASLPTHSMPQDHFYIAHGFYAIDRQTGAVTEDTRKHTYREYTWYGQQVMDQLQELRTKKSMYPAHLIAVGHTHITGLWLWEQGLRGPTRLWGWEPDTPTPAKLKREEVFFQDLRFDRLNQSPIFFNPGSVGFPRHLDRCPTYVVLTIHSRTSITLQFREVVYDPTPLVSLGENGQARGPMAPPYPAKFREEVMRCLPPVGEDKSSS